MNKSEILAALSGSMERTLAAFDWDAATLARSYGAGKWNGKQILGHLVDCELNFLLRVKFILAESEPPIVPFEENEWARRFQYQDQETVLLKDTYRILRQNLIAVVRGAAEADLERAGKHPQRPGYTAGFAASHAAGHNAHHLEQLDAIKAEKTWIPKKQT